MKIRRHLVQRCLSSLVSLAFLSAISTTDAAAFVPAAPMSTSHAFHTATLLADGKVLVAGGEGGGVEVYDSFAGTWTTTGSLKRPRTRHSATLLQDGRVLAARGFFMPDGNASAELYSPVTGVWTEFGDEGFYHASLPGGDNHTATLLGNGQVLFVGGYDYINHTMYPGFLYDPTNGTWFGTYAPGTFRILHTATLLPDGKVLIAGGETNGSFLPSATCMLFDPATEGWTNTGAMSTGRMAHTATLLQNGKVLVVGGDYGVSNAELYDPATGTWSATGSMSISRSYHTATLLPDGKVLVVGGNSALSSAELYDPVAGTWSLTSPLNVARYHHTASLLPNGDVLIAGGWTSDTVSTSSAELYQQYPRLLAGRLLAGGDMEFTYQGGISGNSYSLERSLTLAPADWIPQATNSPVTSGTILFTNTPVMGTHNFWRIRSVP